VGGGSNQSVKMVVRAKSIISCKPLFQTLEILTLPYQYVLYLKTFFIHNLEYFTSIFSMYNINKRKKVQLHGLKAKQIFFIISKGCVLCTYKDF